MKKRLGVRLFIFFLCTCGIIAFLNIIDLKEVKGETISPEISRQFQWRTAGSRYIDPTSFFSVHGYVDGTFANFGRDWESPDPSQIGMPGQVLVPNTSKSSFIYDAALFFASELSPKTRLMLETHLVSDPSGSGAAGPGGLTIVVTEATASWDLFSPYLTVSGGTYWAPFGTVNYDWLGAQNLFTLIPRASGAFPAHFSERGIRINGAKTFTNNFGVNYVFSIGNGLQTFDIMGQSSFDKDEDKTFIGRIGLFPGLGDRLDIGYSLASGKLRENADLTKGTDDLLRYPSDFLAHGIDAIWQQDDFKLRSYFIFSDENLDRATVLDPEIADITRKGLMTEVSYFLRLKNPIIGALVPKFRYDWVDVERLKAANPSSTDNFRTAVYSAGLSLYPADNVLTKNFYLSLEYHIQDESEVELSNNGFVARMTGMF